MDDVLVVTGVFNAPTLELSRGEQKGVRLGGSDAAFLKKDADDWFHD